MELVENRLRVRRVNLQNGQIKFLDCYFQVIVVFSARSDMLLLATLDQGLFKLLNLFLKQVFTLLLVLLDCADCLLFGLQVELQTFTIVLLIAELLRLLGTLHLEIRYFTLLLFNVA